MWARIWAGIAAAEIVVWVQWREADKLPTTSRRVPSTCRAAAGWRRIQALNLHGQSAQCAPEDARVNSAECIQSHFARANVSWGSHHPPQPRRRSQSRHMSVVHSVAMMMAGGFSAWLVYRYLGLKFVSRSWFNLDTTWAVSLVLVGALSLAIILANEH